LASPLSTALRELIKIYEYLLFKLEKQFNFMSHPANEKVNESEKEAIEEKESVDEEIENRQPTTT